MRSEVIVTICENCRERTWWRLWPERAVCLSCGAAECRCCHPPVRLPPAWASPCPPPAVRGDILAAGALARSATLNRDGNGSTPSPDIRAA